MLILSLILLFKSFYGPYLTETKAKRSGFDFYFFWGFTTVNSIDTQ